MYRRTYKPSDAQRLHVQQTYERSTSSSEKYRKHVDPNFISTDGQNCLHLTLLHGTDDDNILEDAIKAGCDINLADKSGCRPIHYAVEKGLIGCTKKLIQSGADVNVTCRQGMTPLIAAVRSGSPDLVKLLVKGGAKVNFENDKGESAVHHAVGAQQTECLSMLMKMKANINAQDSDGNTALILATKIGNLKSVRMLIDTDADVNRTDTQGKTALHWAVLNNRIDCGKRLIESGADIDKPDKQNDSPFVVAIKWNVPEMLKLLMDNNCDQNSIDGLMGTALGLASLKGHLEIVKILLESGEDPDEYGYFGMTPLMLASFESHVDIVKLLLQYGADPNSKGRMCGSALHKALIHIGPINEVNRHRIVAVLIRANADINARLTSAGYFTACTRGKNCPLSFAVESCYLSLIRMLLLAGSQFCISDFEEWMKKNNMMQFSEFSKLISPIVAWKSQPRTLKQYCRWIIRKNIHSPIHFEAAVEQLGLAKSLQQYINYAEFDDIPIERVHFSENGDTDMLYHFGITPCGLRALEGTYLHQTLQGMAL